LLWHSNVSVRHGLGGEVSRQARCEHMGKNGRWQGLAESYRLAWQAYAMETHSGCMRARAYSGRGLGAIAEELARIQGGRVAVMLGPLAPSRAIDYRRADRGSAR